MRDRDAKKMRTMRANASALRDLFAPQQLREVSLDEICGVEPHTASELHPSESVLRRRLAGDRYDRSRECLTVVSDGDRCDGCRRGVPLVCVIDMQTEGARVRRRYCAECARLIADLKPSPIESA